MARPGSRSRHAPDRLEHAVTDGVSLLALIIDERAIILAQLEDPSGRAR